MPTKPVTLTENQFILLDAIITDDFQSSGTGEDAVWTWSPCEALIKRGVAKASLGGIFAKAQEAGLIGCQGRVGTKAQGDDDVVWATTAGVEAWRARKAV